MKKNKLLAILSLALTLSCLLSALSMNVFAGMLESYYYVTNEEFTAVTNTYGYSSVAFTGNYYGPGDSRNDAILACEADGGPRSRFTTEILVYFAGDCPDPVTSDSVGHRTVSVTYRTGNIQEYDYASSIQSCWNPPSEDDVLMEDNWERYYCADWCGFPYGWDAYFQSPE